MFFSRKISNFKNVNHCFFSRNGGNSLGLYQSLNCGLGSQDIKENVIKNLEVVSSKFKIDKKDLITMNQTHSSKVILVTKENKKLGKFNCDAMVTNVKGLALGVLTADCVPIILYDSRNKISGVIHAGWKGAVSGIIENTISIFNEINSKNEIYACIGPCIGKESYEVGLDFFSAFLTISKKNEKFFLKKNDKKFFFDLRKYVGNKLKESGVKIVDNVDLDTFKEEKSFFSYRRSVLRGEKDYGRCMSIISFK